MKHFAFTLLLSSALTVAYAQKVKPDNVPAPVEEAFSKMYPDAKNVEWEMEDGNYEAEVDINKIETSVVFTPAGAHVMTEVEIAPDALPAAAINYVKTNLGGKKIKEAAKMTTAAGVVTYEAEVDEADYIFDASGAFLKKEVENEGDEKKDKH